MRGLFNRTVFIAFSLAFTSAAHALESAPFIPTRLATSPYSKEITIFAPAGHTIANPNNCTNPNGYVLMDGFSGGGHAERTSLALAALLNQKNITVNSVGCHPSTFQPIVQSLSLYQ